MKNTLPAILLYVAVMHYLFVACLASNSNGLKTSFLVVATLAGAYLVSLFNHWEDK